MRKTIIICFALVVFSVPSISAQQQKTLAQKITKAEAVQKAKKSINGRILKVQEQAGIFQIKVLQKSGRVTLVEVNKQTGKVNIRKVKH
jgi:uncharacterized membrane protein YkoI